MAETEELKTFAEAAGLDTDQLAAAASYAWQRYDDKEWREARALFRGLAAMQPDNPDHLRGYALASLAEGDHTAALEAINNALAFLEQVGAETIRLAELTAFKATVLIKAEEKADALAVARKARALSPDDAPWVKDLDAGIEGLEKTQRFAKAPPSPAKLSDALADRLSDAANDGLPMAWVFGYSDADLMQLHGDGMKLIQTGQLAQARRVFEGLVALDPGVPLFHVSLATVCDLIGDVVTAEAAYEQAIAHAEHVAGGDDLAAGAYLRRGMFRAKHGAEGAKDDFEAALSKNALGDAEKKQCEEALAALARAGVGGGAPQADEGTPPTEGGKDPAAPRAPPGAK